MEHHRVSVVFVLTFMFFNATVIYNIGEKRLSFKLNSKMLHMFGCTSLESVLTLCVICWFGNASEALGRQ